MEKQTDNTPLESKSTTNNPVCELPMGQSSFQGNNVMPVNSKFSPINTTALVPAAGPAPSRTAAHSVSSDQQHSQSGYLGNLEHLPPPPPKPKDEEVVRNIEILSQFVVNNGPEFENMAREKQGRDSKFSFLHGGKPGTEDVVAYEYFQWFKKFRLHEKAQGNNIGNIINMAGVSGSTLCSVSQQQHLNSSDGHSQSKHNASIQQEVQQLANKNSEIVENKEETNDQIEGPNVFAQPAYPNKDSKLNYSFTPAIGVPEMEMDVEMEDDIAVPLQSTADGFNVRTNSTSIHEESYCAGGYPKNEPKDSAFLGPPSVQDVSPVRPSEEFLSTANRVDTTSWKDTQINTRGSVDLRLDTEVTRKRNRSDGLPSNEWCRETRIANAHYNSEVKERNVSSKSGSGFSVMKMDSHGLSQIDLEKPKDGSAKVDRYGRIMREGNSDSESDDYPNDSKIRGGPKHSRSPSMGQSRYRRRSYSRSPRRRTKWSVSRSPSPKRRRSRSRTPHDLRHTAELKWGGNIKGREKCNNFARGRCHKGPACRYLHIEPGESTSKFSSSKKSIGVPDSIDNSQKYIGNKEGYSSGQADRSRNLSYDRSTAKHEYDDLEERRHPESDLHNNRSASECNDFKRGKCYRGSSCRFRHSESASSTRAKNVLNEAQQERLESRKSHSTSFDRNDLFSSSEVNKPQRSSPDRYREPHQRHNFGERSSGYGRGNDKSVQTCKFFARGCCQKGSSCKYLHHDRNIDDQGRRGGRNDAGYQCVNDIRDIERNSNSTFESQSSAYDRPKKFEGNWQEQQRRDNLSVTDSTAIEKVQEQSHVVDRPYQFDSFEKPQHQVIPRNLSAKSSSWDKIDSCRKDLNSSTLLKPPQTINDSVDLSSSIKPMNGARSQTEYTRVSNSSMPHLSVHQSYMSAREDVSNTEHHGSENFSKQNELPMKQKLSTEEQFASENYSRQNQTSVRHNAPTSVSHGLENVPIQNQALAIQRPSTRESHGSDKFSLQDQVQPIKMLTVEPHASVLNNQETSQGNCSNQLKLYATNSVDASQVNHPVSHSERTVPSVPSHPGTSNNSDLNLPAISSTSLQTSSYHQASYQSHSKMTFEVAQVQDKQVASNDNSNAVTGSIDAMPSQAGASAILEPLKISLKSDTCTSSQALGIANQVSFGQQNQVVHHHNQSQQVGSLPPQPWHSGIGLSGSHTSNSYQQSLQFTQHIKSDTGTLIDNYVALPDTSSKANELRELLQSVNETLKAQPAEGLQVGITPLLENVSPSRCEVAVQKENVLDKTAHSEVPNTSMIEVNINASPRSNFKNDGKNSTVVQPMELETIHGTSEISQSLMQDDIKKQKEAKAMRIFRAAIAEFVKDFLKPTWKEGHLSKEAFKTIVKKVVDKVSGSLQSHQIPRSQEKSEQYLEMSKQKLTKLIEGYVDKYVKT